MLSEVIFLSILVFLFVLIVTVYWRVERMAMDHQDLLRDARQEISSIHDSMRIRMRAKQEQTDHLFRLIGGRLSSLENKFMESRAHFEEQDDSIVATIDQLLENNKAMDRLMLQPVEQES
jgi:hypothetical protein